LEAENNSNHASRRDSVQKNDKIDKNDKK